MKLQSGILCLVLSFFVLGVQAQQAPEWTLKDAEGNEVSLSDYRGKPLILHFWATWCPYCTKLQPGLESLYQDFQQDGLELLGISFLEDEGAEPQKALESRGHTFKTVINGDEVAKEYGVKGTPTTFFIDRNGTVIWMTNNSNPDDPAFEQAVEYLLKN